MNKKFARFAICLLSILVLLLAMFVGSTYILDPMFKYHAPFSGVAMSFDDGRYQNPGIARNFDYDSLLLGTSVSANFKASQFDDAFSAETAKIIYLDGHFSEFKRVMDIANETHDVKQVFWGIDSNILLRNDDEYELTMPEFMYNTGFSEDMQYLFNKDIFLLNTMNVLGKTISGGGDTIDSAYSWGDDQEWSTKKALRAYNRAEPQIELKNDIFLDDMNENIDIVSGIIENAPETDFYLFMPPYSALFWDNAMRQGIHEAILNAQEQALLRLAEYDNVHLFYFMNDVQTITNLDNYTDSVHYSPKVNEQITQIMAKFPAGISKDDVPYAIGAMRTFLNEYDFDAIFEQEGTPSDKGDIAETDKKNETETDKKPKK